MTCTDFCTAVKCEELEQKIRSLESTIQSLQSRIQLLDLRLEGHIIQPIPLAHNFEPELTLDITPQDHLNYLFEVKVNDVVASNLLTLTEPEINLDVFDLGANNFGISMTVGTQQAQDSFTITEPQINLDVFDLGANNYGIAMTVGTLQAQANFVINIPENNDHVVSNLKISGLYYNNYLTLTVADGESSDSTQIFIDTSSTTIFVNDNESQHIPSNLKLDGSYFNDKLILTVADGESQDTTEIEIFMDCDLSEVLTAISNLSTQLTQVEINLNDKIQIVEDEITIDISAEINSDLSYQFPIDDSGEIIPTYAESKSVITNYSAKGLLGLHQSLLLLHSKIDATYTDSVKAIDPLTTITYNDLYRYCDDSGINRSDFAEDEEGEQRYIKAIQEYYYNLLIDSKYGYLVENIDLESTGGLTIELITAPNNWINPIISDFSLIQSRINNAAICNLDIPDPPDVVAVVSSPEVITSVQGKVLNINFVTLDNYPKMKQGGYPRPIQIPGAKPSYQWETDFQDLRWVQGNQYAEMELEGYKKKVSGWFKDEQSANVYFDQVLNLTTATQKNRNFPKHTNPRTDIVIQETRPHRAFITSVNAQGRAICHIKYAPPKNAQ